MPWNLNQKIAQRKIAKIFADINKSIILCICVLSIFFSLAFSELISDWVISKVHYSSITILASEWLVENGDKGEIRCDASIMGTVFNNNGFGISLSDQNCLVLRPQFDGAEISFELPIYPNIHLTFEPGEEDGAFLFLKNGNYIRTIATYERENHLINYYPFSLHELLYIYIWYIFFYIIITCFIFAFILGTLILGRKLTNKFQLNRKAKISSFVVLSLIYFFYLAINYYFQFELFQVSEIADAYYYMHPIYWDSEGHFSLQTYIDSSYSFRGYIQHLIAIIGQTVCNILKIDVMYFYFLLWAILIGGSICFIIPKLYETIFNKNAPFLSPIIMYTVFFLFWRAHGFYFLSDIPAAFLALNALTHIIIALNKEHNKKELMLAGVYIGGAAGFRSAYSYIAYAFVFICIIKDIVQYRKLSKYAIAQGLIRSGMFCIGLFMILWPQIIINKARGHLGLFPYDQGWMYDAENGEVVSLMEFSFSFGLHSYQFMSNADADQQLKLIDNSLYEAKELYKIKDILYIILDNPRNFFVGYLKKIFWAISAGYETAYSAPPISNWQYNLLIILNYLLLWNVLFHLFVGKLFKKRQEYIITIILLCGLFLNVVPQGFLHIEKRYFLFSYLLIYLYNSFFLFEAGNSKTILNFKYCSGAILFSAICYAFRMTVQYNFL